MSPEIPEDDDHESCDECGLKDDCMPWDKEKDKKEEDLSKEEWKEIIMAYLKVSSTVCWVLLWVHFFGFAKIPFWVVIIGYWTPVA